MEELELLEKMLLCGDIHITKYNTGNIGLRYCGREYISKDIKGCIENMKEVKKFLN